MKAQTAKSPAVALDNLAYLILSVKDVLKAVSFYRDTLGMRVKGEANPYWTELESGGCTVALHKGGGTPPKSAAAPIPVFRVADVRGTYKALKARGVKASEPHEVCSYEDQVGLSSEFRDPQGNRLSIFGLVKKGS